MWSGHIDATSGETQQNVEGQISYNNNRKLPYSLSRECSELERIIWKGYEHVETYRSHRCENLISSILTYLRNSAQSLVYMKASIET
jgi:hypothetical protein